MALLAVPDAERELGYLLVDLSPLLSRPSALARSASVMNLTSPTPRVMKSLGAIWKFSVDDFSAAYPNRSGGSGAFTVYTEALALEFGTRVREWRLRLDPPISQEAPAELAALHR